MIKVGQTQNEGMERQIGEGERQTDRLVKAATSQHGSEADHGWEVGE